MSDWQLSKTYHSTSGEVRWDRFGNPDGESVVLLHGTVLVLHLEKHRTRAGCHPSDLRLGHARLRVLGDVRRAGHLARGAGQDFADLLDHWGLTRPLVVAHDSGGAIALGAHLLHRAPYRRLALVDAVALPPWGSPLSKLVGEHVTVFNQLPPQVHRALVREYVNSASSPGLHPATLDALVEPWLSDGGQPAFYRQIAARLDDQRYTDAMQDRYGTITVPVLISWGEDDTWVPVNRGRELTARIPGSRFQPIPGAGHLVQEDRPAELATTLFAFLNDLN